ncbi:MAG TPA: gluconolaconase [Armatimonadetes bacterium]|nr:gluconolaconase [Armatimonadota bacterium]
MSALRAEPALSVRCHLGEGPLWHPTERSLYWCDIEAGSLHRWTPGREDHRSWNVARQLGGFTFQADGSVLLFCEEGRVRRMREGAVAEVAALPSDPFPGRFNDVSADPAGGVVCGTMPRDGRLGALYRLSPAGHFQVLATEVGCSNGIGFSPSGDRMYFVDSPLRRVDVWDFDPTEGCASNRRPLADFGDLPGVPDGLTVDAEGCLWVAFWDGSAVWRLSADGERLARVEAPTRRPTSVAIGGPDGRTAYVTSYGGPAQDPDDPLAGLLFAFPAGVEGKAEHLSRIETQP